MKSAIITNKGCEPAVKDELSSVFGIKKSEPEDYVVKFEADGFENLMEICYKSQSAAKVLVVISEFDFKNIKKIKQEIEKSEIENFLEDNTTFSCRAAVFNNDGISKQDLEPEAGEAILNAMKKKRKVNLDNPDVQFYVFINGKRCIFGIDFSGIDLSMREYKVFTGREDLKGNVAFSLLRFAGYKKGDKLIDPFMRSGIIPIEAALYALKFPVNYYQKNKFIFRKFPPLKGFDFEKLFAKIDKQILEENLDIIGYDSLLRNVKAAQKNAKISGILKRISLTRQDVEWLDIKLGEHEADKIVTLMPRVSKVFPREEIDKDYKEFFYQADYILNKKGVIVLVSNAEDMVKNYSEQYKFKIKKKGQVWQGSMALDFFIIERA